MERHPEYIELTKQIEQTKRKLDDLELYYANWITKFIADKIYPSSAD